MTVIVGFCGGCLYFDSPFAADDEYGRIYYIDGAGNWGYGVPDVPDGLQLAGYDGRIIIYKWSQTLNPVLDQTIGRPFARLRGKMLAEEITRYHQRFPDAHVHIIALSAGTGVAVWACEHVTPPAHVQHLIMLSSSLSSTYDITDALAHVTGGVWVYYSDRDLILQGPVRILGTIDGKLDVEPAGSVGLLPDQDIDKVHNIPWSPDYQAYGWTGAHTNATSSAFICHVIAPVLLEHEQIDAPFQGTFLAVGEGQ